jgi:TolA-binding protein
LKNSIQLFLTFVTVSTSLLASEPSAFGAGDITSANPYGLTTNEKVLLETEKKLKKVAQKSHYQENQLDSLRERIDGLQSIVENLSRKAHNNKVKLQEFQKTTQQSAQTKSEYENRLAESISQNTQEIEKLQKILDEIKGNYITKEQYNALVDDVNNFKDIIAKSLKTSHSSSQSKISSFELSKKAKSYYDKRYYTKAIAAYEDLIARNYKPAYAHYMIGDMYYKRKNYAKAISFFKKSAKLYSKASYMPKLLLHTAISMDKTGDKAHAQTFYAAVVAKYPKSAEAREAKKHLK